MSMMIGIDLGTSTTEACVFQDGKPVMILNPEGQVITPSAVGLDEQGNWVAGARAKAQYLLRPESTAIEVKRKTGTGEPVSLGKAHYSPVELQSRLLSYIRASASEYLGENIEQAVISVPAYFNDSQRQATKDAGRIAGLNVLRIVNEPTAAALAYGLDKNKDGVIAVYDLGGGTFDVSILEIIDGVFEVKSTNGDTALGGSDFDARVLKYLIDEFKGQSGIDLSGDKLALQRLKEAAEKAKIELSSKTSTDINLPYLTADATGPKHFNTTLTRAKLESLVDDLIQKTIEPCRKALADAGIDKSQISEVILVGGQTRMPKVVETVKEFFRR